MLAQLICFGSSSHEEWWLSKNLKIPDYRIVIQSRITSLLSDLSIFLSVFFLNTLCLYNFDDGIKLSENVFGLYGSHRFELNSLYGPGIYPEFR
jgi:hypothetical protein